MKTQLKLDFSKDGLQRHLGGRVLDFGDLGCQQLDDLVVLRRTFFIFIDSIPNFQQSLARDTFTGETAEQGFHASMLTRLLADFDFSPDWHGMWRELAYQARNQGIEAAKETWCEAMLFSLEVRHPQAAALLRSMMSGWSGCRTPVSQLFLPP